MLQGVGLSVKAAKAQGNPPLGLVPLGAGLTFLRHSRIVPIGDD